MGVGKVLVRVCEAVEYVPLDQLQSMDGNPRTIKPTRKKALKESLTSAIGIFKPFLVWEEPGGTLRVIGGNQRVSVLKDLKRVEFAASSGDGETRVVNGVPVVRFRGPEDEAKLVSLRDNNSDGDWDYDTLPAYLASLESKKVDLSFAGFDSGLLASLVEVGRDSIAKAGAMASKSIADQQEAKKKETTDGALILQVGAIRGKLTPSLYERLGAAISKFDTFELAIDSILSKAGF